MALSLHLENCKQNDVWPEKLIEELSHLSETLKEKKMENLDSIEIYYAPTMSNEWTTIPQVYINAIVNFDKFFPVFWNSRYLVLLLSLVVLQI